MIMKVQIEVTKRQADLLLTAIDALSQVANEKIVQVNQVIDELKKEIDEIKIAPRSNNPLVEGICKLAIEQGTLKIEKHPEIIKTIQNDIDSIDELSKLIRKAFLHEHKIEL